ncbi:hypothetical protein [Nonomuraea candida]|uniref:hypothetical protein n=1 Tax=Nonomuraea candida TaxID=359159 RepID=UPI0012FABC8D|nr:hypothetical protein [Nonomuraea candida]
MAYEPDAVVWKTNIPTDREGARVRYFDTADRYIPGAGEVTFTLAGGTHRWFVQRSHFGSSDQPHRTKFYPNRRAAREVFEHLAYG